LQTRGAFDGDEQPPAWLRAKTQPASDQNHGSETLDEAQPDIRRIHRPEEDWEIQISSQGKKRLVRRLYKQPALHVHDRDSEIVVGARRAIAGSKALIAEVENLLLN
jgi:hypothetical protein